MSLPPGSHRRYNPLLDEWVLCSPGRLRRPWQGHVETAPDENLPAYDPACYLCPGNARAGGARNPAYTSTFAFDNDFAALTLSGPSRPSRATASWWPAPPAASAGCCASPRVTT